MATRSFSNIIIRLIQCAHYRRRRFFGGSSGSPTPGLAPPGRLADSAARGRRSRQDTDDVISHGEMHTIIFQHFYYRREIF